MALDLTAGPDVVWSPAKLALQGIVAAVANPKSGAFFIALLPPFIDPRQQLPGQHGMLMGRILGIECF